MNPPPSIILPSRRDALRWGAAGAVAAAGLGSVKSALGDCVLSPSETEGPYWVDEMLSRSDVRPDPSTGQLQAGLPLRLSLNVSELTGGTTCSPVAGLIAGLRN